MGATYVDVIVRNPADPHRSWTGKFLVDRAFDSLVPREHRSDRTRTEGPPRDVLADGKPANWR